MPDPTDMEPGLAHAIVVAARSRTPLDSPTSDALIGWLTETWGERVNGGEYRFVTVLDLAMKVAWEQDDDNVYQRDRYLAMSDPELLAAAQAAVQRVFDEDVELNLPSGTDVLVTDSEGETAHLINLWGGGYIASAPDQEFQGPYSTADELGLAWDALGAIRTAEDVTAADIPAIRAAIAAEDV